jgi:hypothetical protein
LDAVELATEELAQVSGSPAKRAAMLDDESLYKRTEGQMGNEVEDVYKRLARF